MTATRRGTATFAFTDRTVTMERTFEAPMALVFEALTKPEHLSVWFPADDAPLHYSPALAWPDATAWPAALDPKPPRTADAPVRAIGIDPSGAAP